MKYYIHVTDNNAQQKNYPDLVQNGASKLFDFSAPNDFAQRSIWEVEDREKFHAWLGNNKDFLFFLLKEEQVEDFRKYQKQSNQSIHGSNN